MVVAFGVARWMMENILLLGGFDENGFYIEKLFFSMMLGGSL